MMNIILFDMDGTVTEARERITEETIISLKKLCSVADIGIVTGSGIDYVFQQCEDMWLIGQKIRH